MVWTDNLNGFSEVVQETFHLTEVQKCIVHQIRNSLLSFCCKDLNSVMTELNQSIRILQKNLRWKRPVNLMENGGENIQLASKDGWTIGRN